MTSAALDPGPETIEARLFDEADIPWGELAFKTVKVTLEHFFEDRRTGQYRGALRRYRMTGRIRGGRPQRRHPPDERPLLRRPARPPPRPRRRPRPPPRPHRWPAAPCGRIWSIPTRCSTACVEVCRLHGQHATRASLSAGLPLTDGRLTLNLAERAAARAGMATKLQRAALADIDAATLPVVLLLKGDKACVLLGREQDRNRVLLPETGQGTVLLGDAELAARATGLVLYVRPHFRFDKRTEADIRADPGPLVLEHAAGPALRLQGHPLGRRADQRVRAGAAAVLDERVRPRRAQRRVRDAVGAGHRHRS